MPHIRVLEAIAGADFSWVPGDVVEVSEEEAASWADGHRAVLADDGGPAGAQPAMVHQEPDVVGEDGRPLEVLAATLDEVEAPDGAGGARWVRWSVTVRLPADGDRQTPAPADPAAVQDQEPGAVKAFDPREHTNREVLAYLDGVGEQEALRVLGVEAGEGENRAGIGKLRDQVLQAARERDAAEGAGQAGAEKAADYSRGGGGAPAPETRDW
ncbi:hypothetical protein SZN_09246 [Streptomyces zinciresistens K42]|uniref:Uncharacterized protein n=1 Tax=Streptomyces zinciresistens K42 TaxID=700597 RepID=G2G8N1_9ACTN|nr:hypothetical protein [Streptomyces zinciresistens]EGX60096.1 hypothetical protein SZN_09246 [Streptomyces zinciresistens K42]